MRTSSRNNKQERLVTKLNRLWKDERDRILIANTIEALNTGYDLNGKITKEPGVERSSRKCLEGWQIRLRDYQIFETK